MYIKLTFLLKKYTEIFSDYVKVGLKPAFQGSLSSLSSIPKSPPAPSSPTLMMGISEMLVFNFPFTLLFSREEFAANISQNSAMINEIIVAKLGFSSCQ
jgi:hypothetical protein